jgi:hypothetical protein
MEPVTLQAAAWEASRKGSPSTLFRIGVSGIRSARRVVGDQRLHFGGHKSRMYYEIV